MKTKTLIVVASLILLALAGLSFTNQHASTVRSVASAVWGS